MKMRAALGGIFIALAALYALARSYDISLSALAGFFLGSAALLLGAMVGAVCVVFVVVLLRRFLHWLRDPD